MDIRRLRSQVIVKLIILVVTGGVMWFCVGRIALIHDQNNYPHIKDGDLVISCRLLGYHRNDMVLYQTEEGIKAGRIVGLPEDEIDIREGYYLINGVIPYEEVFYPTCPSEEISYPLKVKEGSYFILNDCRQEKGDSRMYGLIDSEHLRGKIVYVFRYRNI